MTLDHSKKGKLIANVKDYVHQIEEDFPCNLKNESRPWTGNLFKADESSKRLDQEKSEIFHTQVMKRMFLHKRG